MGRRGAYNGHQASAGYVAFGTELTDLYNLSFSDWQPFGQGSFRNWTSSSGDVFGTFTNSVNALIGVPVGYVSGTSLSAEAIAESTDLATLGFTPGSYETTISNGSNTDTILITVAAQSVPEPAISVFIGLLGLIAVSRRRK